MIDAFEMTDPSWSLLRHGRLVACVWGDAGGTLTMAGKTTRQDTLLPVPFAQIRCLLRSELPTLASLVVRCDNLDAFRMACEIEGYLVVPGHAQPGSTSTAF